MTEVAALYLEQKDNHVDQTLYATPLCFDIHQNYYEVEAQVTIEPLSQPDLC